MVVATPCPLILAAPIAFVAGLSRAARAGIIVKGAGALERLGGGEDGAARQDRHADARPARARADRHDGALPEAEALRLAASLDQMSMHVLAESLVLGAAQRGLELALPTGVTEEPGRGIVGDVDGHRVAVGSSGWLEDNGCAGAGEQAQAEDTGRGSGPRADPRRRRRPPRRDRRDG